MTAGNHAFISQLETIISRPIWCIQSLFKCSIIAFEFEQLDLEACIRSHCSIPTWQVDPITKLRTCATLCFYMSHKYESADNPKLSGFDFLWVWAFNCQGEVKWIKAANICFSNFNHPRLLHQKKKKKKATSYIWDWIWRWFPGQCKVKQTLSIYFQKNRKKAQFSVYVSCLDNSAFFTPIFQLNVSAMIFTAVYIFYS